MFISISTVNGHYYYKTPIANLTSAITLCCGHYLSSTSHLKFHSPPTTSSSSSSSSSSPQFKQLLLPVTNTNASKNNSNNSNNNSNTSLETSTKLHHIKLTTSRDQHDGEEVTVASASAVASTIRRCSTSPVEFVQRIEKGRKSKLVMPSSDFLGLCAEQLDLFRRIVNPDAILSVYVRPAGSYVMDRLELRRITSYPGANTAEVVILIGNFNIPTGLRAAEAALSCQQVELVSEHRAVVFPMVKHPFVVGFLVAELPEMQVELSSGNAPSEKHDLIHLPSPEEAYGLSADYDKKLSGIPSSNDQPLKINEFTAEQRSHAIQICQSLAMAYVMDQKAMLLQQSSWQNNVRMSNLVEQIRGPLSSLRTLSKMLSAHVKKSEISYDIVEDILLQGDRISNTLQELQDAVYLTKANIVHYNEETLKKISSSTIERHDSMRSQLSDGVPRNSDDEMQSDPVSLNATAKDLEMPMPPLALAPLQHGIRPCNVSEVLSDMMEAVRPLAHKQKRMLELRRFTQSLQVSVEEPALRQALSNLIEGALLRTHVGGKIEITSIGAPAGGALVVIDDDGPDMHYMTQMHSLTPFGAELFSENMIEDNMTWNFVAGLTVAREILESYGCVVRVISPRLADAALGAGGTRIEVWLPSSTALTDLEDTLAC